MDAGIIRTEGFLLNVSNYIFTKEIIEKAEKISKLIGEKNFIIDVSINGNVLDTNLFGIINGYNPEGRTLGIPPSIFINNSHVDAFLWIKRPGEKDVKCNGGLKRENGGMSLP